MENKNIFEMLPDQDSSDDEQQKKEKQKQRKQKERQDTQEKKKYAETQQKAIKSEPKKGVYKSDLQKKQEKKVTNEAHPLDRRSGTGRGKEMKKQGGGAGNWGNTKDIVEEDKYVRKEDQESAEEKEIAQVEEKEEITLDDYLNKYKVEEKEDKKKEEKVDLSSFIKEGCQVVTSKKDKNIDADEGKKKGKKGGVKDYSAGMTTEHTDLLGLKTGFKPLPEKKPRRQFEEKKEKEEVKQEQEKTEEVKEEGNETEKKDEKEQHQQQQYQRGGKPFRGGRRGGRGGYQKREKNEVMDEKQKLKSVQKVIEDEANFPKLG